jgi:hypothetical protein
VRVTALLRGGDGPVDVHHRRRLARPPVQAPELEPGRGEHGDVAVLEHDVIPREREERGRVARDEVRVAPDPTTSGEPRRAATMQPGLFTGSEDVLDQLAGLGRRPRSRPGRPGPPRARASRRSPTTATSPRTRSTATSTRAGRAAVSAAGSAPISAP